MKIAIYGAGSLGTVIGAFLVRAGYEVDLITRNREHLDGFRAHGARITGTVKITVPVHAFSPEGMTGNYDYIFLLTKQGSNESVVPKLARHLSTNGVVCTFQNGLPEQLISDFIGPQRTFGCTVGWGATLMGNGISKLTSDLDGMNFELGRYDVSGDTGKLEELRNILQAAGNVRIIADFISARWWKLLINSSFSAISALLGCTLGEATRRKRSRDCIRQVIRECFTVAQAAGVEMPFLKNEQDGLIDEKKFQDLMHHVLNRFGHLTASLLHDMNSGRLTEVEFINGAVWDIGCRYNLLLPYCCRIIEIIHRIESGELRPEFGNVGLFEDLKRV